MSTPCKLFATSVHAFLFLGILVSAVNCVALDDVEFPDDVLRFEGHLIYFRETDSYRKKCESFKLTLKEARAVFEEFKSPLLADTVHGQCMSHFFIVDNAFVFSEGAIDKQDLPISGVYVDGITGKITIVPQYSAIRTRFPVAWRESLEKWEVEWAKEALNYMRQKRKIREREIRIGGQMEP